MWDIVYFVKEGENNEQLRYSLRSLVNYPHSTVWVYGYCPAWCVPDKYVHVRQDQANKWLNVVKMIKLVCENNKISKNFLLFNDDFYVMGKIKHPVNYYNGDLYKRIVTIEDKFERITPYSQQLRDCCKELEGMGCNTRNFTLHVPMLINRKKALEVLRISDSPMFRSIYGNYCNIKAEPLHDVKIVSTNKTYKSGKYLSTDDNSFAGMVGEQIKAIFTDKSKYEI